MEKTRYACDFCGKGIQHSNLVSFAKNRVHIVRRPNLHTHRMEIGGESVKLKLCTSCKKSVRLTEREQKAVAVAAK